MKRATREWLKRCVEARLTVHHHAADALATDAEVKRLRRELKAIRDYDWANGEGGIAAYAIRGMATAALKPVKK